MADGLSATGGSPTGRGSPPPRSGLHSRNPSRESLSTEGGPALVRKGSMLLSSESLQRKDTGNSSFKGRIEGSSGGTGTPGRGTSPTPLARRGSQLDMVGGKKARRRKSSLVDTEPDKPRAPDSVFLPVEMADLEVGGTVSMAAGAVEAKPGVRMHYEKETLDADGDHGIYIGERKDGQYHGEGSLVMSDKSQYVGQWKEGRRHGRGTYTFPDGAIYSGMWKLGVPHGEGRYTWASGEYYDGNYNDGKREGYGTMQYRVDGKASDRYEGFWHQGYKEGRGRMTYGQLTVQKQLIATSEPFDKYTGEFKRGYRHGKGIYTFKDGSSFQGYYKYGLRHGLGVFFFKESFLTQKTKKQDAELNKNIPAYISEWDEGVEIPGAGLHTTMNAVAKKAGAAAP